jgi:glycosyltransferase involved in cell wall biosynthesis
LYATRHNPRTHYLPTVVDTERYQPADRKESGPFTVGWIGSPSTGEYLAQLVAPLSAIGREGPVRFVVVGAKAPAIAGVEVCQFDWSETTELRMLNGFDVGVMPLPDSDWARGKCAFKLIQYMACGLPVVASPVGANRDVVDADCGLFAETAEEWADALRLLRDQPRKRMSMGDAGRAKVERHFSLQHNLPVLASVLRQAGKRN